MRSVLVAFVAFSALAAGASSASAQSSSTFTQRDTTYIITFSGGVSTAWTQYDNTLTLPAGGQNQSDTLTLKTGAQGLYFGTTGTVTTTFDAATTPAGASSTTGDVTNGGGGGTFTFGYQTANSFDTSGARSWTWSTTASGHNVIEFVGGGTNFLDTCGTFNDTVLIEGDWSTSGTAAGDHEFLGIDPGWVIGDNFVYNTTGPWAGYTDITAVNTDFLVSSTGQSASLDFYLFGAPTPEPSTWAMMILGLLGVGLVARRRSTASVAA